MRNRRGLSSSKSSKNPTAAAAAASRKTDKRGGFWDSFSWTWLGIGINAALLLLHALVLFYGSQQQSWSSDVAFSVDAGKPVRIFDRELAAKYLDRAQRFADRGYEGWLNLLASYDYDPTQEVVLDNLVANYQRSNMTYLAFDELTTVVRDFPNAVVPKQVLEELKESQPREWALFQKRKAKAAVIAAKRVKAQYIVPFATAFARFDFSKKFADLHKPFYEATMRAYNLCKEEWVARNPKISDTELNHKFFQWQMKFLRETGDYWSGFVELELYRDLMDSMRDGVAQVLEAYGFDEEVARRKAAHEVIFWVSVHTGASVHEPHMTEDSLIGGVYYSSIPPHSGNLELFDPRQTIADDGLPKPPYHRTHIVTPREGMLVLFPGWLVHSVRPSVGLDVQKHGYRISISVNCKGEWQDTTGLKLDDVIL